MKIGVFGGTFDPIHNAHLIIAEFAREQLLLDKIFFVPSHISPHKTTRKITSSKHRVNMIKRAIKNNRYFSISEYEIRKKGLSYTVDTIDFFTNKYNLSIDKLFMIIGSDNFNDLQTWKNLDKITKTATIAVANRSKLNAPLPQSLAHIKHILIHSPLIDISSSLIRSLIKNNSSVRYLVPAKVEDYIQKKELYLS